jgi:hypothetical protein
MKSLIKVISIVFFIFFSISTKAQRFQVGCSLSVYSDYLKSDTSFTYEEEKDSSGLVRRFFISDKDMKMFFFGNKDGVCTEILMAFKTKSVFDAYVEMFDTEWTDLGMGNWIYDDKQGKFESKARILIENNTVFIHINGYYYGDREK